MGKLIDPVEAAIVISQLLNIPLILAKITIVLFSLIEISILIFIWKKHVPFFILFVPMLFLVILIISNFNGIECGCFGSLPIFSKMSFGIHLFLLAGIFFCMLLIVNIDEVTFLVKLCKHSNSKSFFWLSNRILVKVIIFVIFLIIFFTLKLAVAKKEFLFTPGIEIVNLDFVKETITKNNAIIIDARPEFQFKIGHIPNSINIPYNSKKLSEIINMYSLKNKDIIVYCSNFHCQVADLLINKLKEYGCINLSIYRGGWDEWKNKQ